MSGTGTAETPSAIRRLLAIYGWPLLLVVLVSIAHYNTHFHIHALHGIYRRLYYFPIIIAAFRDGRRGGLVTALAVIAMYVPHAFGLIGFDPGTTVEKLLEMALYLAVGWLAGSLVSRINAARDRLRSTAEDLQRALDEKTAMEDELIRSARLAAVGRLSAGLAHEIRNPLASIRGSAEVLSDDYPGDHPKGRLMRILLDETGRLNQVLTRFLQFARHEPGESAAFDLGDEMRAVAELMAHRDEPVTVRVDVPPECPAARGDRAQVRQVLLNLTLNAAAAAGADGSVALKLRAAGERLECRVIDSGPGFTDEARANFGNPFYSTREGGTGLGLATSVRLAEGMGGTLAVEEGEGGQVLLTLPVDGGRGRTPAAGGA